MSFWTLAFRSVRVLAGAVLLWCGLIFTFITGATLIDRDREDTYGRSIPGTVTAKELRRATEQSSTAYLLTYRVSLPDGGSMQRTEPVPPEWWERATVNHPVAVRYEPGRIDTIHVDLPRESDVLLWVVLGSGATLAAGGGWLLVTGIGIVRQKLHIAREGRTADGFVVSVHPTNLTINNVPQWAVSFEFVDDSGERRRGESDPLSPTEASQWEIGDRGIVRFDPRRPESGVWMGR